MELFSSYLERESNSDHPKLCVSWKTTSKISYKSVREGQKYAGVFFYLQTLKTCCTVVFFNSLKILCNSYLHPLKLLHALPFSSLAFPHCPAWAVFYFPICLPSSLQSTGHPRANSIHNLENKVEQSSSALSFIPVVLITL